MKLDAVTYGGPLAAVPDEVRAAEAGGYDGWFVSEVAHDPFLACALAAEHRTRVQIGTAIAVAFARSPMQVACQGPLMLRVAGEVTDGLLCHVFTTERYLRTTTLPALIAGAERAGRSRDELEVSLPVAVVTGRDEAERDAAATAVRGQLAFYGSTPAYRGVLDAHGWGELHEQLHAASLRGEWEQMAAMIDDEVMEAFVVVTEPDRVGADIRARYGDLVDRVSLSTTIAFPEDTWSRLVDDLRA